MVGVGGEENEELQSKFALKYLEARDKESAARALFITS